MSPLKHPYRGQPTTAFWSKAVSTNWNSAALMGVKPLIHRGEKIASAGSCFAANIIQPLEAEGFEYLRTRSRHPAFAACDKETYGYDVFSAGYGNVYTARQLLQLLRRSFGRWQPKEDRWLIDGRYIDPFRPGLRYPAASAAEFDALLQRHLQETKQVFEQADVFVFTLGLTEAWISRADGAVFPAAPGVVAGNFDPDQHGFENYTAGEVIEDLNSFVAEATAVNPCLRLILTVSPVPLVATATDDHVLIASSYSKAALRAAAGEVSAAHAHVSYFPAFEIVTGPQAPDTFFEPDRRTPSGEAINAVMATLVGACERAGADAEQLQKAQTTSWAAAGEIANALADAECEEAMNAR